MTPTENNTKRKCVNEVAMNSELDRFVVLRHDVGDRLDRTDQTHFDWMFEVEGELRTWATAPIETFEHEFEVEAERLPNHRLQYLDFEGEISGGRGVVQRVLRGHVQTRDDDSQRFTADLFWDEVSETPRASIAVYRSLPDDPREVDESREVWRLRFSLGR